MKDFKGKLYDVFNKMTYKYQYEKDLKLYQKKISEYTRMSDDEFLMQYIEVNAKYKRKKILLSVLSISFIASIVFDIWQYVLQLIVKMEDVTNDIPLTIEEYSKIGIIFITFGATVLTTVILIFCMLLKDMYNLSKEKYFLEEMKLRRIYPHSIM